MSKVLALMLTTLGTTATADGFGDDFVELDRHRWHVAHYDFNHPSFDTDWRRSHATVDDGLTLELSPHGGLNRFAGASIRTLNTHHFGRYETRLRAARGDGVITGFFTYTGPHYHTRHDEIDIEFLGKDTTRLHAAWFVDGHHTNQFIQLGFDAADCTHDYAFEWWPDKIIWFVNGQRVFERTTYDGQLPKVPGHLFANIWAADPSIAMWSGIAKPDTHTSAHVEAIRFTPFLIPRPES